jgi:uroporphyrin-III C-methyltransferase
MAATEKPSPTPPAGSDWSDLAASLAAAKASRAAQPPVAPPAEAPRAELGPRASFASGLALVLAVVAIAVTGMLWWQYRAFYVSLDQTDIVTAQQLDRVRAEQRVLQDGLKSAHDDAETLRQRAATLGDRIDLLPGRFAELERRLDAVQGGSFEARSALLRSEAEYYLGVANTELTLGRRWQNAITALELADGRLAELGSPELSSVREEIASELLALRSVKLPDIEGMLYSLGRLAARAGDLPMRADVPATRAAAVAGAADPEPGFARLWESVKSMLLGLVRIERRDEPVAHALSAAERELGRRELEIELEVARTAALRGQQQAFRSALDAAIGLLQRDFDTDSGEVEGALALLREMRGFDVDPKRPDVGASLVKLRELSAKGR